MYRQIMLILLVFTSLNVFSQDKIITTEKDTIVCDVLKLTDDFIEYQLNVNGTVQQKQIARSQVMNMKLDANTPKLQEAHKYNQTLKAMRFNLILPSLELEIAIKDMRNTAVLEFNPWLIKDEVTSHALGASIPPLFQPRFKISYRHYYNLTKRMENGDDTRYFRGNYFGIMENIVFGTISSMPEIHIAPIWGIQRASRYNTINISAEIGPRLIIPMDKGAEVNPDPISFGFYGTIRMGFIVF